MNTFKGAIATTIQESIQHWPELPDAGGRPNVIFIVLDDVGFGQLGCYGSDIATPTMDRLAAGGLQYTQFHTTALCAPTRAGLLSGRNHHSNGFGSLPEMASGFPGYNAMIPKENGLISEILRDSGYSCFAVGKWHLTPDQEMSMAGPFDRWPLGKGFDRFYGFLGGGCHQFVPGGLVSDNHFIDPPRQEGYHISEDLTDQAISFVRDLRSADERKPFFLNLAYGACHSPHHAPPEYIAAYRGQFDRGWDQSRRAILDRQRELGIFPESVELPERNPGVPAWDDLSSEQQRLFARMQEVYAGFVTHTDAQIGRLVDELAALGELENTVLVLLSDNGASAEGGAYGSINEYAEYNAVDISFDETLAGLNLLGSAASWNHYPVGWAMAGNTPFRLWKRYVYQGGVADPCIVHWPAGIDQPGLRDQYHHVIDIVPTVLDAVGVPHPETLRGIRQTAMHGTSMTYTFTDRAAPTRKGVQLYEMLGGRAIWRDGWKAVSTHEPLSGQGNFDSDVWELFRLDNDPTESRDLAKQHPELLGDLVRCWWEEAERYGVLPLDDRGWERFTDAQPIPRLQEGRHRVLPWAAPAFQRSAVDTIDRSFSIRMELRLDLSKDEGVLLTQGSAFGGYTLYVQNGSVVFAYKVAGLPAETVEAKPHLEAGRHVLEVVATRTEQYRASVRLLADGVAVAGPRDMRTAVIFPVDSGMTCGYDRGIPVTNSYPQRFAFTGEIRDVTITLGPKGPQGPGELQSRVGTLLSQQ